MQDRLYTEKGYLFELKTLCIFGTENIFNKPKEGVAREISTHPNNHPHTTPLTSTL
jgi:hypothetical protein